MLILVNYNAKSQECRIKFVVKDMQTNKPIGSAIIEEHNSDIGVTGIDGVYITSSRETNLYNFTIKKPGYEVWQDYVINAVPDTTETTPPVYLSSLDYLKAQMYIHLDKPDGNADKINELYMKINKAYEKFGDEKSKMEFNKEFQIYRQKNQIKPTTVEGKITEFSRPAVKSKINSTTEQKILNRQGVN